MKVIIGADHRGFALKEKIKQWLFKWGYDFFDVGAASLDPDDDFPKYASQVASLVASQKVPGILLCGSGVGVEIIANKFDGVRAAICQSAAQTKKGREDDDMNVLVIAADFTLEYQVEGIVKTFLETKFERSAKHVRRVAEITKIEANN